MLTSTAFRWSLLILCGSFLLGASLFVGQDEGAYGRWVGVAIAASVTGGLLVCLAAFSWRRQRPGRLWLLLVIATAVAFRLAAMPASRDLSDDAYRYHWDGKVVCNGINPYLHAPDDAAVAHLHVDAIDQKINHPWYRTCYPPLAQLMFAVGYKLTPGRMTGLQLLGLTAELLTWLLVIGELRRRRLPLSYLLLCAWMPLVVFQGYAPGHLDVLALPLVVAFIILTSRGQAVRAGVFLALACLIKPLPLLFLPAALRELRWPDRWRLLAAFAAVAAALYAPFWDAGWKLFSSTWLMATKWSFHGSLGALLEDMLPMRQAHFLAGMLLGIAIAVAAWRGRDLVARMLLAMTAFVVFTPTLFPWYLIVALPLLALRPDPALLGLVILIPLVDEVIIAYQTTGVWQPAVWPTLLVYIPYFTLLALSAWRRWGVWGGERRPLVRAA